jgi:hypothetical protein
MMGEKWDCLKKSSPTQRRQRSKAITLTPLDGNGAGHVPEYRPAVKFVAQNRAASG